MEVSFVGLGGPHSAGGPDVGSPGPQTFSLDATRKAWDGENWACAGLCREEPVVQKVDVQVYLLRFSGCKQQEPTHPQS